MQPSNQAVDQFAPSEMEVDEGLNTPEGRTTEWKSQAPRAYCPYAGR
jgi:hypothetical protein